MFTGSLMGTSRFFSTRVLPAGTLPPKLGTYGAGVALDCDGDTASDASGCAEAIVVPVNTLTATSGTQTASVRPGWRRIAPKRSFVFMYSRPPFSAEVDPLGDRRDAARVVDEQHVPAGRRHVVVAGHVQPHAGAVARYRQRDVPLVRVGLVGDRGRPDELGGDDPLVRLDVEAPPVMPCGGA